jgi:phosphoesterase RecJ-like protein
MNDMKHIQDLINKAEHIVVIQADNPDADSLASSLALEHILGDQGKTVSLYCGIDIPGYLHYLPGYDRVSKDLPKQFDLALMVDCSTITLMEQLERTGQLSTIKSHPFAIIDHHASETDIPFTHDIYCDPTAVSTGEIIYKLADQAGWPIRTEAAEFLASSILADSLGLTIDGVSGDTIRVLAALVDTGVSLSKLEDRRRTTMAKPLPIIEYKGRLLERIEYYCDNQLAVVVIPWKEIEQYSPLYNPGVLALEELRFAEGVKLAVALKTYPDGKITGKLRCNYGSAIAGDLAAHFGGGGHASAAGFKTTGWQLDELKKEMIKQTVTLLDNEQKS